MAKPPIIISNGGIAEELAKGLKPATGDNEKDAWKIIMRNVKELNQRKAKGESSYPVAKSLSEEHGEARIIWRLSDEKEHPHETADAH
ncbi:hypothetical protein KA005_55795 [bacterium]|nr:hypothetical protein [bacterium]